MINATKTFKPQEPTKRSINFFVMETNFIPNYANCNIWQYLKEGGFLQEERVGTWHRLERHLLTKS